MPRPGFTECPLCAELIREQAIFCRHCQQWLPGAAAPAPAAAGAPSPPLQQIAKFVPREVRELILEGSDVSQRAEWRVITVVFADIVGFTRIGEQVDPETLKAMMERCFREMLVIIEQYGGTVMQFMGDATMAFFGAPVAHEDDPERAVRASLDMIEAIRRLGRELGQPLELSIGINTGEVCVGYVDLQTRADYTAFGDTVNTASRLEGLAGAGEIVISERVAKLVKEHFVLKRLPPAQVKNRRQPVVPHLVRGLRFAKAAEPTAARRLERAPFIGRRREMEALARALGSARRGAARVVQVTGAPGVGKTRLIDEFLERAGTRGVRVHRCHCVSYGQATPYHAVIELIRNMAGIDEGAPAPAARKRLAALAQELGLPSTETIPPLAYLLAASAEDAPIVSLGAKERKQRIFAAVHTLLRAAAVKQTLILTFDDVQWADTLSLEVFEAFVASLRREKLLLLVASRPEAHLPAPPMDRAHAQALSRITLTELSQTDSERLLREILGLSRLPREIGNAILKKTEGNPFFVQEVVRQLQATGVLVKGKGGWRLTRPIESISVSDTLQGVIQSRIDGLERSLCRVLQVAAVIGQTFRYRLLAQVSDVRDNLTSVVSELVEEEFIAEVLRLDELAYLFRNLLVQEVAYQSLLRRQRREVHRRVGETVERLYPDTLERWTEVLAHHFYHSDDGPKAAHYLALAADKLERLYANEALTDTCQRLLEVLASRVTPGPDTQRLAAETHIRLGRTHKLLGETAKAVAAYNDAIAAAEAAEAPDLVAHALRNVADVHRQRGEHDQALAELERAERLWRSLHMADQALTCLNSRGVILRAQGRYADANRCFQQAVKRSREQGNLSAAANAMNNLGLSQFNQGQYQAALKTFREALAVMTELLDKKGQISVLNNIGIVEERLGHYDRALDAFRRVLALAREINYAYAVDATLINVGQCHQFLGDQTRAIRAFSQVIDRTHDDGNPLALSLAQGNLARSLAARGDRRGALRAVAAAHEAARASRQYLPLVNATLAEGETHLAFGQPSEALECARRALALCAEHGDEDQRGQAHWLEGTAHRALGELAEAAESLEHALTWARRTHSRRPEAWALWERAQLRAGQGQGHSAEADRQQALALARELGDAALERLIRRRETQGRLSTPPRRGPAKRRNQP